MREALPKGTEPMNNETLGTPVLTPEDIDCFVMQGYVVVKNAVPPEQIAAAVAFLEGGDYAGDVGAANFRAPSGSDVEACLNATVFGALRELFGPEYPFEENRGASDMPRVYQQGREWKSQPAHVDDDYPTLMPANWAIGMFLFLTKARSQGGAFQLASGSPFRYREAARDNPETLSAIAANPALSDPISEYLAEPGDLLLFHHLMGHAGSDNVSDPATRHALLARFHPHRRIVPGAKPFAAMSPIEKVNSARYLRERENQTDATNALPDLSRTAEINETLTQGFAAPDSIIAHMPFLSNGVPHYLFVSADAATSVLYAPALPMTHSKGGVALHTSHEISYLHRIEREMEFSLIVDEFNGPKLWTGDPTKRTLLNLHFEIITFASAHYCSDFGSKIARGNILCYGTLDAPNRILGAWGRSWDEAIANRQDALIAETEPGSVVADAFVRPVLGEGRFALIADVRDTTSGEIQVCFAQSSDAAHFPDALSPIAAPAALTFRQIRVLARARNYWLVTYLADVEGKARIFMGFIDWEKTPATLEPIRDRNGLSDAYHIVGWL